MPVVHTSPLVAALDLANYTQPTKPRVQRRVTVAAPELTQADGPRGADGVPEGWLDPVSACIMERPVAVRAGKFTETYDDASLTIMIAAQREAHAEQMDRYVTGLVMQAEGLTNVRPEYPGDFAAHSPLKKVPFETRVLCRRGFAQVLNFVGVKAPVEVKRTPVHDLGARITAFLATDAGVWDALTDKERDAISDAQTLLGVDRGNAVRRVLNDAHLRPTYAKHFRAAAGEAIHKPTPDLPSTPKAPTMDLSWAMETGVLIV